jgi:hypothetical protein
MQRDGLRLRVPNPHGSKDIGIPILAQTIAIVGVGVDDLNAL